MRRTPSRARLTSSTRVRSPTRTSAPRRAEGGGALVVVMNERADGEGALKQELDQRATDSTDTACGARDQDGGHRGMSKKEAPRSKGGHRATRPPRALRYRSSASRTL